MKSKFTQSLQTKFIQVKYHQTHGKIADGNEKTKTPKKKTEDSIFEF